MSKLKAKTDFSAGGVVWDPTRKKVLLVRVENLSGQRVWTFPKGHPEPGESDPEAALREVREETGWQCEIVKTITDVHYWYVHNGIRTSKTVRWFLMKPLEEVGAFDPGEILECRWGDLEEAEGLTSYRSDKDLLKQLREMI